MVTDDIETFVPEGIRLASGRVLAADLIVAATGLELLAFGGVRLSVDGADVDPAHTVIYRGFMVSGLPNLAVCFGYTNASWTLRADLTSQSVCRLLNRMDRAGQDRVVPRLNGREYPSAPCSTWFRVRHQGRRPAPEAGGAGAMAAPAKLHSGSARRPGSATSRPAWPSRMGSRGPHRDPTPRQEPRSLWSIPGHLRPDFDHKRVGRA